MATDKQTNTSNKIKNGKHRKRKTVTLLIYIEDYIESEGLNLEDEMGALIDSLRNTIITEEKKKARG